MSVEIWKPIKGYEGLYEVSNRGRVKSLERTHIMPNGAVMNHTEKILCPVDDGQGYFRLNLNKNGKSKKCRVHRLVAEAFIENPNNKNCVNHIDGNKQNNCVSNLEWCTQKENVAHAYKQGLSTRNVPVLIVATDPSGKKYFFESQCEAERITGVSQQNISMCCNGKLKTAGGFAWRYQGGDVGGN